jgi:hypothetical protein
MESGQLLAILSTPEVIGASIFLMLLLPLVFFIASTRSKPRRPAPRPAGKPAKAVKKAAEAPAEEDEDAIPSRERERPSRSAASDPDETA